MVENEPLLYPVSAGVTGGGAEFVRVPHLGLAEPEKRVRRFLLMRRLKIDESYAFNKSEFVGEHCRSTGLQSRLEAP